jgi:hypothetical protein
VTGGIVGTLATGTVWLLAVGYALCCCIAAVWLHEQLHTVVTRLKGRPFEIKGEPATVPWWIAGLFSRAYVRKNPARCTKRELAAGTLMPMIALPVSVGLLLLSDPYTGAVGFALDMAATAMFVAGLPSVGDLRRLKQLWSWDGSITTDHAISNHADAHGYEGVYPNAG